jgi:glycosyltransferase involved in cell wall biosynthesis
MTPPITVLMSVYNGLPHLPEAIDSILQQTFSDFEFLIIDDASTDGSHEVLAEYAQRDPGIRILTNELNHVKAT